jgi:hypothetical protein
MRGAARASDGLAQSAAALGRATAVILADLLRELAIYADDCASWKAEPEDLLLLAKEFLQRCVSFRFYVNAAKLTLICNELEWLGRVLRDGKVLVDPSYVSASRRCTSRRTRARSLHSWA